MDYKDTANYKLEEGGEYVKPLCFLWKGLHM